MRTEDFRENKTKSSQLSSKSKENLIIIIIKYPKNLFYNLFYNFIISETHMKMR